MLRRNVSLALALVLGCIGMGHAPAFAAPSDLVINEVLYAMPGADTMEFVEILNKGADTVDLSASKVYLLGSNGGDTTVPTEYFALALTGTVAGGEYYVVAANNNTTIPSNQGGSAGNGFTSLQDGPGDSLALIIRDGTTDTLIDLLTYEGAAANPQQTKNGLDLSNANPVTISVSSTTQDLSRLPNGANSGNNAADFGIGSLTAGEDNQAANTPTPTATRTSTVTRTPTNTPTSPGTPTPTPTSQVVNPGNLLINEVIYNNLGTDNKEFVEIYNPTGQTIDFTAAHIYLIGLNGQGAGPSTEYLAVALVGAIEPQGYFVITDATNETIPHDQHFSATTNALQNGPGDSVALVVRQGGTDTLIDLLTYEGAAQTAQQTVNGLAIDNPNPSTVQVRESDTTSLSRLPDGVDTGNNAVDFGVGEQTAKLANVAVATPTPTDTPVGDTATPTDTSVPPTATPTSTSVPPTATPTRTPTRTATPTGTPTNPPGSATSTPTDTPTVVPGTRIVVDNTDPGFSTTGTWVLGTGTGRYGADYAYHAADQSSSSASWHPQLPLSGIWQVSVWYAAASNRVEDASYTVSTVNGPVGVTLNQKTNGGVWNVLGNFYLDNTTGTVTLLTKATTSGYIIADAVSYRFVSATTMMIVDNANPSSYSSTAGWTTSMSAPDQFGFNYQIIPAGSGTQSATWDFVVAQCGFYNVEVYYPSAGNRAPDAHYTVIDRQTTESFVVDQRSNSGHWVTLHYRYLSNGTDLKVVLTNQATSGNVLADAVRLEYTTPPVMFRVDNTTTGAFFMTGTWNLGTGGGAFGGDYRYAPAATGAEFVLWRPFLSTPGVYQVAVYYPGGPDRTVDAPYIVGSAITQNLVRVNQQARSDQWVILGDYFMPAGTQGFVRLATNATTGLVIADAIRMTYMAAPLGDWIVDNRDSGFSVAGAWTTGSGTGKYAQDYRFNAAGTGTDTATWQCPVAADDFLASIFFPPGTNRSTASPFRVIATPTNVDTTVNQQQGFNRWIVLNGGNLGRQVTGIQLTDNTASGYVIADAARFMVVRP